MEITSERFSRWLFLAMLAGMSLFFTVHVDAGYLSLKRIVVNVCLLALLAIWGRDALKKETVEIRFSPLIKPLVALVVAGAISLMGAFNPYEGLALWLQWLDALLLVFLVANLFDKKIIPPAVNLLLGVGLVVALYGLAQEFGLDWVRHIAPHTPFSTLGNVNWAAQFLVVLCPLALVTLISESDFGKRLFAGISLALMLIHLFLTHSRGGWLAVVISFLFILYNLFFANPERKLLTDGVRNKIILIALLLVIGFVSLLILKPGILRSGNNTRLQIWRSGIRIWFDNPVKGVGPGNFKLVYPKYRLSGERAITSKNIQVDQAHNEFLQFLTDTGFLGFLAFIYFIYALFQLSRTALSQPDNPGYLLNLGLVGALLGVLVHSLFSFPLQNPASLTGFITVAALLTKSSGQEPGFVVGNRYLFGCFFKIGLYSLCIFSLFFQLKSVVGDYWFTRGQIESKTGRIGASITSLQKSVANYPFNFRPWFLLGYVQSKAGNYQEAAGSYEYGHSLNPNFYLTRYQLGNIYTRLKRFQEAIMEYDYSLSLVPEQPLVMEARSKALVLQKTPLDDKTEIPDLTRDLTSKVAPPSQEIQDKVEKAREYEKNGEWEKAIVEYKAVYSLDPGLIMTKFSLGMVYLKLERLDEALFNFNLVARTTELPPAPRSDAYNQVGYVYFLKKDFVKAENNFFQALKLAPQNMRAFQYLGNLYYAQGRKKKALTAWKQALTLSPGNQLLINNVKLLEEQLAQ